MKDYNVQNNKFIKNGLVIIEKLHTELSRYRIDRLNDDLLLKFLDYLILELDKIKIAIENNPRFQWVLIQEEIDRLYSEDKNLTGINIQLNWKDGENRGYLNYKINKEE